MNQIGWAVIIGAWALSALGYYLLIRNVLAVRQGVAWIVIAALRGVLAFVLVRMLTLAVLHRPDLNLLALVGAGLAVALTPKRSRHIPARVRRNAIARYERKSGQKFDSREMHLDHRLPFARGGSHTADNLRVIAKTENLRKGKRRPGLRDWF